MKKILLYTRLVDNSIAKVTLEKSWVHNNLKQSKICEKIFIGEQKIVNKCKTKSGKTQF